MKSDDQSIRSAGRPYIETLPIFPDDPLYNGYEVEKIGQVSQKWANIHNSIFLLFEGFTKLPKKVAVAIFFSIRSDSQQRQIALSAIQASMADKSDEERADVLPPIAGFFAKVDGLSRARNFVVHGPMSVNEQGAIVMYGQHPERDRATGGRHFTHIDQTIEALSELQNRSIDLVNEIAARLNWQSDDC